ncbi:MAG: hypothetical protein ACT4NY_09665 [Pseudonocardiales bacterium]
MTTPRNVPARQLRHLLVCLLLMLGVTVLFALPATAHEAEGPGSTGVASDARSSVVTDDLPPGVILEVLQNGLALRLHNGSSAVVTLLDPPLSVPPGKSVQWHLDAAHPSPGPTIQPWHVAVDVDGVPHQVLGEVRWTPGPSPWPWLAGATLLAIGLAVAAWRLRRPAWLAVPLGLAVVASIVHTAGALAARTAEGPRSALAGDYLPPAGCWALGALAVVLLARDRRDGVSLAALAALGLVLVTLIRDAAVLGASTVLVTLPADVDRVLIAGATGLSAGVLAGLILGLYQSKMSASVP